MSEFEFACPVCGQHIFADSSAGGTQIDCPTCFRPIVVPQPPSLKDSTLILTAAQPAKPRPPTRSIPGPPEPEKGPSRWPAILLTLALIAAGIAAWLAWHHRL